MEFTKRQQFRDKYKNQGGLFFDKTGKNRITKVASPTCKEASALTFGPQGFTGTCAGLIRNTMWFIIFLFNRGEFRMRLTIS